MKQLLFSLLLIFLLLTGCVDKEPLEIYPMKNLELIYKGVVQKDEYFVVYHHRGKSNEEIERKILEYNRATISLDTVWKYRRSYKRFFYRKTRLLTVDYREVGNDAILDHGKDRYISLRWEEYRMVDSTLIISFGSNLSHRNYRIPYKISEATMDSILTPIVKEEYRRNIKISPPQED